MFPMPLMENLRGHSIYYNVKPQRQKGGILYSRKKVRAISRPNKKENHADFFRHGENKTDKRYIKMMRMIK